LNKEVFDIEIAAEFDKHCEVNSIPTESRKKTLLGFRSTFLKRKVDEASEEEKDKARKLIETMKAKEHEHNLYQYGWPDSDTISREELVRRHEAMERAE
jgi:hypothetical protein